MKHTLILLFFACIYSFATAQKTDTITTASGLKYFLTKKGSGRLLKPGEIAVWHYSVALGDGSKLDDSRKNGSPLGEKIPSGRMIKGTSEALLLMHVGDRGVFILPPSLAYGRQGADGGGILPPIPPNATLYFDMELLDIKKTVLLDTLQKTLFTQPVQDTSTPHVVEVISLYKEYKKKKFADAFTSDNDLNTIGYFLLPQFATDAIRIFLLNVEEYPKISNVYDSLGEAYMAVKDFDKAILNYEKSIELDPANTNATKMIKQMKDKRSKTMQQMD
ncbi:MAG: FKBP-type peptidyl-prolyl cis-trans isomerase [Bacteroidota bacterium]